MTATAAGLTAEFLKTTFDAALPYRDYVATGNEKQRASWDEVYTRAALTDQQRELVAGFTRDMPVLVSSGIWCGDCVRQCPILQRIAEANPDRIDLRFVDRDEHLALAEQVKICGGLRVPVVVFMAEDFEPVQVYGDRTLSRYRAMAAEALGAACPVPGAPVPASELSSVTQDWLDEFERTALVLRLSARLRQKHSD